mmetsp:Transcript_2610/g.5302  ORF Transcript_2610/g.5302 Transcript_2610/m.5302 type:complete len:255 (-) Transcript_2610:216-980(-)
MDRQIRLVRRPRIGRNDLEAIGKLNGKSFLPEVSREKEELRQHSTELLVEDLGDHADDTQEFSIGSMNSPINSNGRKGSKSSERKDSSDSSSFSSWTSSIGPRSPCAFTRLYDFANTRSNQRTIFSPKENAQVNSSTLNCKSNSRTPMRSNEWTTDVDTTRVNSTGILPVITGRNSPTSLARKSKRDSVLENPVGSKMCEFVKLSSGGSSSSVSAGSSPSNRSSSKNGSGHRSVMSSFRFRKSDKSSEVRALRE